MTYLDKWHNPAYRLRQIEKAMQSHAGDGFFCHSSCLCHELGDDEGGSCEHCQNTDEFSASSCDLCSNPLAGARESITLVTPTDDPVYYSVCIDCAYYIEYGQLDDQSMLDIEDQEMR
jgi:hypothetical protein